MTVTNARRNELYDRIEYRVTVGYKVKLENLAKLAGLRSVTAYLESLIDDAEERARKKMKKDRQTGCRQP